MSRRFDVEQVQGLMQNVENVRNLSVIAHVDHGKSTLTDSLACMAGIIKPEDAGKKRTTDTLQEEQDRAITIKSTGVSLYFEAPDYLKPFLPKDRPNDEFLANLIDSPGHVDFSSEVTAALRITDGALVVVDSVSGVAVQTETVLRQALTECVKPTLVINKMDRMFLELEMDFEEQYQRYCRIIEDVNVIVSVYQAEAMGDWRVDPAQGTVGFCSGYYGWGFTIDSFARFYAEQFKTTVVKMRKYLWGNWFYNEAGRKWTRKQHNDDGSANPRGFCKFVLEPIAMLTKASLEVDEKPKRFDNMVKRLQVKLKEAERASQRGRDLLRLVMQRWMPAGPALRDMILTHLPSPKQAQVYRAALLYSGPCKQEDPTYKAICECDPNGPLVFYVSKIIALPPTGNQRTPQLFAFGRVFSGTIKTGQTIMIDRRDSGMQGKKGPKSGGAAAASSSTGAASSSGDGEDAGPVIGSERASNQFVSGKVQRVTVAMCSRFEPCSSIPAGNTAALVGIDKYLRTTGTLLNDVRSHPLHPMRFSVSPVVRVSVRVTKTAHLPHLVQALRRLSATESLVQVHFSDSGEHTICAVGELHMEITLNTLRDMLKDVPLLIGEPVVSFRESVTAQSDHTCMAKSANRHNRIYIVAEPLGDDLVEAIESGKIRADQDTVERSRLLVDEFGWSRDEARKIWCFGPDNTGANIFVDQTRGEKFVNEIADSVAAAMQWVCAEGPLGEEPLRGVRFNLVDVTLHADAIHRGGGQIIQAARRAMTAAMLCAKPVLVEPIFLAEIVCPNEVLHAVHSVLNNRRGYINSEEPRPGTNIVTAKGFVPVLESFGFSAALRTKTSGQAFPQLLFDHYEQLPGNPLADKESKSLAAEQVRDIRKRKKLTPEIKPETFEDRL